MKQEEVRRIQAEVQAKDEETRRLQMEVEEARRRQEEAAAAMSTPAHHHLRGDHDDDDADVPNGHGHDLDNDMEYNDPIEGGRSTLAEKNQLLQNRLLVSRTRNQIIFGL